MAVTASTMLPLGTKAPDFSLPDVVTGKPVSLADFAGRRALLVMFICRHCPFVRHIQGELAQVGRDYAEKDIGMVAISANDPAEYSLDRPVMLRDLAVSMGFKFPLCFDESQETARAYTAACTPDFFLFDSERKLVYRGRFDDSCPGNNHPVTGRDLRAAIHAALKGAPVDPDQKPSVGCSIKWKSGSEPSRREKRKTTSGRRVA